MLSGETSASYNFQLYDKYRSLLPVFLLPKFKQYRENAPLCFPRHNDQNALQQLHRKRFCICICTSWGLNKLFTSHMRFVEDFVESFPSLGRVFPLVLCTAPATQQRKSSTQPTRDRSTAMDSLYFDLFETERPGSSDDGDEDTLPWYDRWKVPCEDCKARESSAGGAIL